MALLIGESHLFVDKNKGLYDLKKWRGENSGRGNKDEGLLKLHWFQISLLSIYTKLAAKGFFFC